MGNGGAHIPGVVLYTPDLQHWIISIFNRLREFRMLVCDARCVYVFQRKKKIKWASLLYVSIPNFFFFFLFKILPWVNNIDLRWDYLIFMALCVIFFMTHRKKGTNWSEIYTHQTCNTNTHIHTCKPPRAENVPFFFSLSPRSPFSFSMSLHILKIILIRVMHARKVTFIRFFFDIVSKGNTLHKNIYFGTNEEFVIFFPAKTRGCLKLFFHSRYCLSFFFCEHFRL